MSRLPPKPIIHFDQDGLLQADTFGDSYFSRDDGLLESRAVFLAGNHLPEAWANQPQFTIGELGFGSGLNVLAAWHLWNATKSQNAILHIVTFEGYLLERDDARTVHARWPELHALSEKLLARWPVRAYGTQRLWFDEDNICITIVIGACQDTLPKMAFHANCWFLDGFAPSKNPDMWSQGIAHHIARLSAPAATIATYSVARIVRDHFETAGLDIRRVDGFGSKRQRLEGVLRGDQLTQAPRPQTAIVIGGGIGGGAVCAALVRRGVDVHLFDDDTCGRTKASGNPVALIAPRLDLAETCEGRFYRSAYLSACDTYHNMGGGAFVASGVLERAPHEADQARLGKLKANPPLPENQLAFRGDEAGLIHTQGGFVFPDLVLRSLKQGATLHPLKISRLAFENGRWQAFGDEEGAIISADVCIVAAGTGYPDLIDLGVDLGARAGQLSYTRIDDLENKMPVCGGGYAATLGDRIFFGATFDAWPLHQRQPPPVTEEGHTHNVRILRDIAPDLAEIIPVQDCAGRTSIRVTTPDHLPLAGPLPMAPAGLYVIAGLGSRGFTTAFMSAEIVASHIHNDPLPLEIDLVDAVKPSRFMERRARKQRSSPR